MINWSIYFKKLTSGFKFFGVLVKKLYAQANFVNLNLIYCLSSCIMSFNLFMHHIVLLVLYFFANLQSALGFVFVSFSYFAVCSCSLILAPCLGRLKLIRFPLPLPCLLLGFNCLGTSVCVRLMRNLIVSVRFGLSVL